LLFARTLRPTAFEVVSAGGAGKPAVLRVQMTDERLPLIDQTTRLPSQPLGVQATITYTLEPDSPTLLVEARLQNTTDRPQTYTLMLAWVQDDGMQMYMPPFGNAKAAQASGAGAGVMAMIQTLRGAIPYAAAVNHTLSYGLFPLERALPRRAEGAGHLPVHAAGRRARRAERKRHGALGVHGWQRRDGDRPRRAQPPPEPYRRTGADAGGGAKRRRRAA
jgi:hypothetical protein